MANNVNKESPAPVSIASLLRSLRPTAVTTPKIDSNDVAYALSHLFTNQLSDVQAGVLLHDLYLTRLEQRPDILAKCASVMRAATRPINLPQLKSTVENHSRRIGQYNGGLCDIVGTGGDGHSTFNISTAASIMASSLLFIAKHGSKASTSKSGAADVLGAMKIPMANGSSEQLSPILEAVTPETLLDIFAKTKYAFLFAWTYHPGVKYAAHIRRQLEHPTIFNLLGPIANPVDALIEARVVGVRSRELVPVFAEALKLNGISKAMVVCGNEDLDEISCAGLTHCARLLADTDYADGTAGLSATTMNSLHHDPSKAVHLASEAKQARVRIEYFTLHPGDFGLPAHPLDTVSPGLTPGENAEIMWKLLNGELPDDNAILHFVLINTAAIFVIAGVCEGAEEGSHPNPFGMNDGDSEPILERGPGGGRWKEGVRLARLAIASGKAKQMFRGFVRATNEAANGV